VKINTVIRCLHSADIYAEDVCGLPTASSDEASQTRTQRGIDVLESTHFNALAAVAKKHNGSLRLGLLMNAQNVVSWAGRR
jgi:hypothetical protein